VIGKLTEETDEVIKEIVDSVGGERYRKAGKDLCTKRGQHAVALG
jgi:hypothetical protein